MGPLKVRLLRSCIHARGSSTRVDLLEGGEAVLVDMHVVGGDRAQQCYRHRMWKIRKGSVHEVRCDLIQ